MKKYLWIYILYTLIVDQLVFASACTTEEREPEDGVVRGLQSFSLFTPKDLGSMPQDFSTSSLEMLSPVSITFTKDEFFTMSADGSTIVEKTYDRENGWQQTAVQLHSGRGTPLPHLKNLVVGTKVRIYDTSVRGISGYGSIVVGNASYGARYKETAVQWIDGEIRSLPFLNKGDHANAYGISGYGSIIVGTAKDGENDGKRTAVQWINGEIRPLPFLNKGSYASASGISGDGSIIVGEANDGENDGKLTVVQWINGEIRPLPFLNKGDHASASGISGDGSIIVGEAKDGENDGKLTAVQWINGEIRPLPFLNKGDHASASGINGDGSIIVGAARDGADDNKYTAVLWRNGKVFSIQKILESAGIDLKGRRLISARAISANGYQVIGRNDHQVIGWSFNSERFFKAVLPLKHLEEYTRDKDQEIREQGMILADTQQKVRDPDQDLHVLQLQQQMLGLEINPTPPVFTAEEELHQAEAHLIAKQQDDLNSLLADIDEFAKDALAAQAVANEALTEIAMAVVARAKKKNNHEEMWDDVLEESEENFQKRVEANSKKSKQGYTGASTSSSSFSEY